MKSADIELMVANQAVRLAASLTAATRIRGKGAFEAADQGGRGGQEGRGRRDDSRCPVQPSARGPRRQGAQACVEAGGAHSPCATTSVFWK